jgi:perosamine synthetase
LIFKLAEIGVETRPFFFPLHTLPMYRDLVKGKSFPVAEHLATKGLNLPSSATLSKEDIDFICDSIIKILTY